MQKIRVHCFAISLDGYGAGPRQSSDDPLGVGGAALHEWLYPTRTFQSMTGKEGGATGVDDEFAAAGIENIGAWILGRNMFGPIRGAWRDHSWKGWWGDKPPFRTPVFVLTNHPRTPVVMEGGTTFHFITGGIEAAARQAREAAGGKDVRVGGGVATIRQFLVARMIDTMHVAISPVLLGSGEHLLHDIDTVALGYRCTRHIATSAAMHFVLARN